jgi:hypothetical protein
MMRRGALLVLLAACDSGSSDHAEPPPDPDATTGGTNVVTFAVDSVMLGDGTGDAGWQMIGYDLDELATQADGGAGCDPAVGEPVTNTYDGVEGRDNAFGAFVLPVVTSALGLANPSSDETQAAKAGKWTLQMSVTGLDGTPKQTASGLKAALFASDAYDGGAPAFDPSTNWPVSGDSVDGGDVTSVTAAFTDGYVTNGTFVAGARSSVTVPLHLAIGAAILHLRVHSALVTFDVLGSDEVGNGILAGTLDPDELAAAVQGTFFRVQCNGNPPDNDTFYRTVDILLDRTNKTGTACNAISFAMAFHGKRIANPSAIAPTPGVIDPCADAGGQ